MDTNSEKTGYGVPPKEYQFKPGQSGNPNGRPKGTLKDYLRKKFQEMTEEEKETWLKNNKINGIDIWKMAEGQPSTEGKIEVDIPATLVELIKHGTSDKGTDN